MNLYDILEVAKNATDDDIKKAYRKLAMKYHPDRNAGPGLKVAEARFKEVKEAYETLSDPLKKRDYDGYHRSSSFSSTTSHNTNGSTFQRAWERARSSFKDFTPPPASAPPHDSPFEPFDASVEFVAKVSPKEAFEGFSVIVPKRGPRGEKVMTNIAVSGGYPNGYSSVFHGAPISIKIIGGNYHVRGLSEPVNLFSSSMSFGDVELEAEADALDLINGAWLTVQDFLGEKLNVRIPAGFNPLHRLKIAGKGYYGWNPEKKEPIKTRQDMYVRISPIFKRATDYEKQKVIDLYMSIQNAS